MTVAAGVTTSARTGAAAGSAGKAAAVGKSAAAVPTVMAPARAAELRAAGTSRTSAVRTLRDQFGGTWAESRALFDAAPPAPPVEPVAADPAPAVGSATSRPSPTLPRSVGSAASTGGGALLGALAYVLALTYLRDGLPGLKRWMRAKFLNQVTTS